MKTWRKSSTATLNNEHESGADWLKNGAGKKYVVVNAVLIQL